MPRLRAPLEAGHPAQPSPDASAAAPIPCPMTAQPIGDAELQAIVRRVVDRTLGSPSQAVALAADHRGFALKEILREHVRHLGYRDLDCGVFQEESADYPDLAEAVAQRVRSGEAWRGIVIDGAGIGSSIAANKVPGIRAALCYNQPTAVNSVEHNDANVLTLGSSQVGPELARAIVTAWLETRFAGGRHAARVAKITALERRYAR